MVKIAIFPGSFDPVTNGHLDLIERSSRLFDEVIVVVATNTTKKHRFTSQQRLEWLSQLTGQWENVRVEALEDGLIGEFANKNGANVLIRGVRNTTDFDYEYSIASANRALYPMLDTVLLYASDTTRHLSSSIIKEIAKFGGDIRSMVPHCVALAFQSYENNIALDGDS